MDVWLYDTPNSEAAVGAVQCKSRGGGGRDVGVPCVHGIAAAKVPLGCRRLLVTNQGFTEKARKQAQENSIELVDGLRLTEMLGAHASKLAANPLVCGIASVQSVKDSKRTWSPAETSAFLNTLETRYPGGLQLYKRIPWSDILDSVESLHSGVLRDRDTTSIKDKARSLGLLKKTAGRRPALEPPPDPSAMQGARPRA